ncbi:GDSL esterase/lipase At1g54790-like [Olea europaea var. sylvestris]|uniref:GDSL esterase/lipase At1g54790-like n=1 Tax=Olea europaea var. sylvestris TaxID=158386 RepID=UPI000C1CF3DC|nr:GDSL esterase/lipase At1g54790-like [Olea europaea var. sylvestris]
MASTFFILQILASSHLCLAIDNSLFNLTYRAVFNFGDSNSDTGGLAAGIAFPVGPPNGQTYFLKPSGRFCDGRLIVDFLRDSMNLPLYKAYLESVDAPNFQSGCNFATGGSTALAAKANSISPFSFGIQVDQFIRFKARVLALLAKDKRLRKFLPTKNSFEQGIYMFDIGQNDVDAAFFSKPEDVIATIPTILLEFETGLQVFCFSSLKTEN